MDQGTRGDVVSIGLIESDCYTRVTYFMVMVQIGMWHNVVLGVVLGARLNFLC